MPKGKVILTELVIGVLITLIASGLAATVSFANSIDNSVTALEIRQEEREKQINERDELIIKQLDYLVQQVDELRKKGN